jgi:hypothetical protein
MSQTQTHFEQVPLEVVKKVAVPDIPSKTAKRIPIAKKRRPATKR